MSVFSTLLLFIPLLISRPIDHNSNSTLLANSTSKLQISTCYFSQVRKNALETGERPEKSVVTASCSSDLDVMGSLANEQLGPGMGKEHPLAVLLCRGAGLCDLDFNKDTVLDQWKNVKICKSHADELLRQWNKDFHDRHAYRTRTATHGRVDACSMPDMLGIRHVRRPAAGHTRLSVQGSDAIMKQHHILVHPGIALCRSHAKYVEEKIEKLFGPPTKKAKLSIDSSDESDTCSDDPSYEQPKEKIERSDLVDSFADFAKDAGEKRVCSTKPWNGMKPDTKERKARTARNLFYIMLGIMVPEGTEEFTEMVQRKTFVKDDWTSGSSKNFEAVMNQMAHQFFAADNRRSRLIVLSLVANSTSYLEVVKYIPDLSRYMYQSAKVFGRRNRMEVKVEKKLERYNREAVREFIEFITSPTVMIGLPYGVRKVKLSDGHKEEIPNSIRQQSATEIIEMWTKICKDNDRSDLLLSPSTMYKILEACTATKRESTACVDYFIAQGMEAFDEIQRIIKIWESEGLLEQHILKRLAIEVSETEQYFRVDYRLHIKSHSTVPDHCAQFALSDPNDKKLASSCAEDPKKHSHDFKCDRCDRANATLERFKEYAEEFVSSSKKDVKFAKGNWKKSAEVILARREEELASIKVDLVQIFEMKKHLLRAAFTNQERERIISSLKDNEALATLDFAQKFLPKFHREKQNQYFGKKGISYHISHITARIGDGLVQHSFVHIYSGSVAQDSTLVILTVSHFLRQLEKVGIKKLHLRSDNAGAYHSSAAMGSLHWLNETTGVQIYSWSFSEAQNGKSSSDRDASRVKKKAQNYVDKGNNIPTSEEFFRALKENPLNGVSVFHGTVTPDQGSE